MKISELNQAKTKFRVSADKEMLNRVFEIIKTHIEKTGQAITCREIYAKLYNLKTDEIECSQWDSLLTQNIIPALVKDGKILKFYGKRNEFLLVDKFNYNKQQKAL